MTVTDIEESEYDETARALRKLLLSHVRAEPECEVPIPLLKIGGPDADTLSAVRSHRDRSRPFARNL
jgi:hypothetical protein